MTELTSKIGDLWDSIAPQISKLGTALAGIILIFYVFKAFIGDEQDTRQAVKNIKRTIVIWIILILATHLYGWLKTLLGADEVAMLQVVMPFVA